ncbi:MAG: undecaprenyldiphospho-muramoylpentapeptide beta-N-acetylglucosaminyltransferase [Epulopiscium sp.]|nr:undecaprenyldiphospho-muramoylpentapeptide beta-N-acetylglucosaminyltransferase [Candidatus Epulonipiscium sp.]
MKRIILTGGGTAGHVTPNLALLPALQKAGYDIYYIVSEHGIEKDLIKKHNIPYDAIPTGKLRRYFSMQNITDVFRVVAGVKEAAVLMKKRKPDIVFSKGGFVAVPVVLAAKMFGVPVIIHESDMTPGLANKIAMPFAKKVCTTFLETLQYVPKGKGVHTGTPIRKELFEGQKQKGLELCGFTQDKPVIMMMGGSLGSVKINIQLRDALKTLLQDFQVVHICGKGNLADRLQNTKGYCQFEYVSEELPHIFAAADVIISRAGSNSISEFLALRKPNVLIPLSANASRGDQILNARSFEKQGYSLVLAEEDMTAVSLEKSIRQVYENRMTYISAMEHSAQNDGVKGVLREIQRYTK